MPGISQQQAFIPVIGIVGGIGSGKSAVARAAASLDPSLRVFDADRVGHEILLRNDIIDRLIATFGHEIASPAGGIDRHALAAKVFGASSQAVNARQALESIVHPAIQREREESIERWKAEPGVSGILMDAALLLEAGWADRCDAIVFVDAPEAIRRERVAARGWSSDELARREASQWPLQKKRAAADFVLENGRTLDIAASDLYQYIQQQYRSRT